MASRLGHKSMEKNEVHNLQYGPKTRLIRGMYSKLYSKWKTRRMLSCQYTQKSPGYESESRYVWTGKFDLNTDTCGTWKFLNPEIKRLRILKYQDTHEQESTLNSRPLKGTTSKSSILDFMKWIPDSR